MAAPKPDTAHDDYQRGSQEIAEQVATYKLFMSLSKWCSLAIAVLVSFLVIWFQAGGSVFTAAFVALVLAVGGFFALKSKPAAH